MKVHDIEQNSVDWSILRSGKVTASELDALVSPLGKVRSGEGVTTYLHRKLMEKWTGGPCFELVGVFDIDQGRLLEERAKPAFTVHTGIDIANIGFVETDDGSFGCSPDGWIDGKCGVEIKCPKMQTHIGYLLNGRLPTEYVAQVQGSMYATGFSEWHFFSYRPQLPPLHLVVQRDNEYQKAIAEAVEAFSKRLDEGFKRLCELNGSAPKRFNQQPKPKQPEFVSETPT